MLAKRKYFTIATIPRSTMEIFYKLTPRFHNSILPSSTNGRGSHISGAEFLLCKGACTGPSLSSSSVMGCESSGASAETGLWLREEECEEINKLTPDLMHEASVMSVSARFS